MRSVLMAIAMLAAGLTQLHAQQTSSMGEILSPGTVSAIFTDDVAQQFNLQHPIRRVYSYQDRSGIYYLALCESIDDISKEDTLHYKIKAVNLKKEPAGFVKTWELNDFINKNDEESSIWFWTKFCEIKDLDGDGNIDPLIVYGSSGINGSDDGRIKLLLYYKGRKIAIRHQNSILDDGRNTQMDAAFYTLPQSIQQHIRKLMQLLADEGFALYPTDYEQHMDSKKLQIN